MTATMTIPSAELATALGAVIHAASTDNARPILTGVLWEIDQPNARVRLVAADNYRLAYDEVAIDSMTGDLPASMVLPGAAMTALLADIKRAKSYNLIPVEIAHDGLSATITFGDTVRAVRLIDGTYPNYRWILPAEDREATRIRLPGHLLAEVAKAFTIRSNNGSSGNLATVLDLEIPADPMQPIVLRQRGYGTAVEILMPVRLGDGS